VIRRRRLRDLAYLSDSLTLFLTMLFLEKSAQPIEVASGGEGRHAPKISSLSCHFVLREAVSQTKYHSSLEVKILGPPKKLWGWLATELGY